MIKPLAPRKLLGCSWVCLAVVAAAWTFPGAIAQDPKKGETPKGKEKGEAPEEPAKKATPKPAAKRNSSVEIMKDPRAEEALAIEKLKGTGWKDVSRADIDSVRLMAAGQTGVDRDTIQRFVQGMGYRLTDRGGVEAWLNSEKNAKKSLDIQRATDLLLEVLNVAKGGKNSSFLKTYTDVLVANLPKLLNNHLLPRTEAIIVLAQTESPDAVPIFVAQLKDPKQTVWVKLWSAQGLTNIVGGGSRVDALGAQTALDAGKALSDYIEREKDAPWPVVWRVVEAIGAMRQSATTAAPQKAEMASATMKLLADPEANMRVRAAAAWAMGMLRVNPQINKYNYALVAHEVGQLAADFGERANEAVAKAPKKVKPKPKDAPKAKPKPKDKEKKAEDADEDEAPDEPAPEPVIENRVLAELYTALLVKDLYQAFNGTEGVRDSGLTKVPAAQLGTAAPVVRQLADLESAVARAAVELIRAPSGQIDDRKKDLGDRVTSLKSYLAKNAPKETWLVPNGRVFRARVSPPADPPADKDKVAGGPR